MKMLVGVDQGGYTFDASAQTVTLTGLNTLALEQVLLITNVTDNVIIYNFAKPTLGGSISSNVITLTYDTTSMSDTDDLQIFIDYDVSGTEADDSADDTGDGQVALTGAEDTILSVAVAANTTYCLTGWDWAASKECTFNLKVMDGVSLVRMVRVRGTNGSQAHGQVTFPTAIEITGGASITLQCTAEKNDASSGGVATAGINGYLK